MRRRDARREKRAGEADAEGVPRDNFGASAAELRCRQPGEDVVHGVCEEGCAVIVREDRVVGSPGVVQGGIAQRGRDGERRLEGGHARLARPLLARRELRVGEGGRRRLKRVRPPPLLGLQGPSQAPACPDVTDGSTSRAR